MGELHGIVVTYLIAKRTIDEDAQIPILVMERVVPTEGEERKRTTDIGLILLVDLTVTIDVLILDIAYERGVSAVVICRIG